MTESTAGTIDQATAPFELKGSLFTLTVMHLRSADLTAVESELGKKIAQAPGFFRDVPVVIELDKFEAEPETVDFSGLQRVLRKLGMVPVGVRNGSEKMQSYAISAGMAVLPKGGTQASAPRTEPEPSAQAAVEAPEAPPPQPVVESQTERKTMMVVQPVRSGQQIYARGGDLIVLGTVSAGAEVLADGNIHIYAPLRGRALAGAQGNDTARIFCHSLEAELVSVAGQYLVSDQFEQVPKGQPVQIHLVGDILKVEPFGR